MLALIAAASIAFIPAVAATPAPLREVAYNVSQTGNGAGIITIDVLAAIKDSLAVRVTEVWNALGRPVTNVGIVAPDGSVRFSPGGISDVARAILPFFGPAFAGQRPLEIGSTWKVNYSGKQIGASTKYSVSSINGAVVTLEETERIRSLRVVGISVDTTASIGYKPSRLVPIWGNVTKHASDNGSDFRSGTTMYIHFERSSDTGDP